MRQFHGCESLVSMGLAGGSWRGKKKEKKKMKKLVLMAAIVSASIAAKAAVSFNVSGLSGLYNGYTIACCSYDVSNTAIANQDQNAKDNVSESLLASGLPSKAKMSSWSEYYAAVAQFYPSTTVADGSASLLFSSTWDASFTKYSVSFLLLQDGLVPGGQYEILGTVYYDGEMTSSPTFDLSNATVIESGTLNTDVVPEPTSGFLLLVGLAGLALKRKRIRA